MWEHQHELATWGSYPREFPNCHQLHCLGFQGQRGSMTICQPAVCHRSEGQRSTPTYPLHGTPSSSRDSVCQTFATFLVCIPVSSCGLSESSWLSSFSFPFGSWPFNCNFDLSINWHLTSQVSYLEKNKSYTKVIKIKVIALWRYKA